MKPKQRHSLASNLPAVADKREAILRAAIRVFAQNGYFSSKVADIASEASVADGTVYLYFKSKEEILHSIFDRSMEEAIAAGKQQLEQTTDPREKLRRIALLHLERLGDDRDLAVVFQVELRGSTKFMEEFSAAGFGEYLKLIRSAFEEGQHAGVFRPELNAKVVAKILFGALDEMATNWILSKRRYKLAPMADQVLDIFLNGVTTNVIVPETIPAVAAPEIRSLSHEYSSYTRRVARTLIMVDHALETLLMLVDEGPLAVKVLVENLAPEEDITKVISELRRCELVEISDNLVCPTPQATRTAESLRRRLKANHHEPS